MDDRAELIERLENLSGQDREVDCLVWAHFDGRNVRESYNFILAKSRRPPHDECVLGTIDPGKHSRNFNCDGYHKPPMPAYTASIDAAVALVEKVKPGWKKQILEGRSGNWIARVSSPRYETSSTDYMREREPDGSPNGAIALLLALLRSDKEAG